MKEIRQNSLNRPIGVRRGEGSVPVRLDMWSADGW
jgi:hypothetical protein